MPAQEKIRVLIVDDIAETRENIRRLLQFDTIIEVIGAARSGREAIEMALQAKPDVIVMDINMPDMDGITATEAIRKKVPFVQVIILSVQSDQNYMRKAMMVGARDFLSKPPTIDELTAAIRRAGTVAHDERSKMNVGFPASQGGSNPQLAVMGPPQTGKIITIYSPKGGTGKTTIATNLAVALHSEETKTLLVDCSLQYGDVTIFLNEQAKNSILDLTPRIDELDPEFVEDVVLKHTATGLRILAAPTRPELAEQVTGEQINKLLTYLKQIYAYIVVDTASYLTETVQAALDVADVIILVTTQDFPAIKNANAFLALADTSGIKRTNILFVMNRYDKRIAISPERVGESLRQEIVIAIPFEERIVPASVNRGIPFVVDNKNQPIGKAIYSLADIAKDRIAKLQEPKPEPAGKKQ
jgi:pilus assembly protein CpaE